MQHSNCNAKKIFTIVNYCCKFIGMGYSDFVQIGRVVVVVYGPLYGKVAVILDVLDQNRVLVEGPYELTGVKRQVLSLKRLKLTPFVVKIPRQARTGTLLKAVKEFNMLEKWQKTTFAQKLARQDKRASINDFDRYKLMIVKRKRSAAMHKEFIKLGGKNLRSFVAKN
jgi:large subunit ribosomal protein L14e